MRRAVEVAFELRTGGMPLVPYLAARHVGEKVPLRQLALELSDLVGIAVSHESVRRWIREG